MAASEKTGSELKDVEAQIKAIRNDVTNLSNLLKEIAGAKAAQASGTLQDQVDELVRKGKQAAEGTAHRAKDVATTLEDHIVEKPVQSALIALLIGMVIGSFGRR